MRILMWALVLYLISQVPAVQEAFKACGHTIDEFLDQTGGAAKPGAIRQYDKIEH